MNSGRVEWMISKRSLKLFRYITKAYQPSGKQSVREILQIQDEVNFLRDQDIVLSKNIDKYITRSRINTYVIHPAHTKVLCCKKTSIFSQNIWN
jgi:hypothetical protein